MFSVVLFSLCRFGVAQNADHINLLQVQSVQRWSQFTSVTTHDNGDDAIKFCNSEELVLDEPSVNNLDGSSDGPKVIKYPEVKPGVDLMVEAVGDYVAADAGNNGYKGGFGQLNMKTGTATDFKFTFVASGTTNPVVVSQMSLSFFDMDEGKRGKARGSLESCGTAASFIPSSTELVQQFKNDCVKTTSCKRGAKKNEPPTPLALTNDHLKRTLTMSYEGKSSATVRWSLGKGSKGRNLMFSLTAAVACAKTTTTTTSPIPTTQPVPHCPLPKAPFKWCRGRDDPTYDKVFLPGKGGPYSATGYHMHMSYGIFWAARTKDGGGVQVFQVPVQHNGARTSMIASIAGIAIKMGDDIVTYTPTVFHNGTGTPKVMVNGVEFKATEVQQKTPSGFVTSIPNGTGPEINHVTLDMDGLCVTDDAHNMQIKIVQRRNYRTGVEFGFGLNMNEDFMDTRNFGEFGPGGKYGGGYGQICMDGGAGYHGSGFAITADGKIAAKSVAGQSAAWMEKKKKEMELELEVHNSQRVKFNESWFGARELGELCDNMMDFRAYDQKETFDRRDEHKTEHGALAGCDEAQLFFEEQKKMRNSPHSTQQLCEANSLSWDAAQQACGAVEKPAFKEACLWEYCNDGGDPDAAKIAEGVEEDAEAAQASADESHQSELNFVPEECCLDDLNCDKDFHLG